MPRTHQSAFNFELPKSQRYFGGSRTKGNPKTARPIATRTPMHLVLRSSHAVRSQSFLMHDRGIRELVQRQAKRFGLRLYDLANAGNHLHLTLLVTNRRTFAPFLRAITGLIARMVVKAERGSAWRNGPRRFWDARPFTRILSWGREYLGVKRYLLLNRLESLGPKRADMRAMLTRIDTLLASSRLVPLGFGFARLEAG